MFTSFFERVRSVTEIENQADLARVLDLDPSSVSAAKARNHVPRNWAFKIGALYGINPNWLLTGADEPRPGQGLLVAGQPLDFQRQNAHGRDPNADPAPQPPPESGLEDLPIARAVAEIERAMRRIDLEDEAIWKAIKSMVDSKLGAQIYGYRPPHAEERPPLAAEQTAPYPAEGLPGGDRDRNGKRRDPSPKNDVRQGR